MFAWTTFVSIDLSEFDTSNVVNMTSMFEWCSNLKTIYVWNEFTTGKVKESKNMFMWAKDLVWWAWTVYDESNIDVKYAHIDGWKENPWYFTAKSNEEEKVVTMVSWKEFAQVLDKLLWAKADPQDLVFERSETLPSGCDWWRQAYSTTTNLDLLNIWCDTSDGNKTIYVQYQDALWNTWPVSSTNFTLDMTAPYITSLSTNATCKTWWRAWTVTWIWNENVVWFAITDISVTNGIRGNNFITSNNPTYSWAVTSPSTGGTYGISTVTLWTNIVTDSCGNSNNTSTWLTWQYDNAGPTFVVSDVTAPECSTWTATITSVSQVWCASAASSQYSWNGGSSYSNSSTHDEYSAWTWTRDVTVRVRDSLWNYTETGIKYRWTDQVLQINSTYDLWLITWVTTISNLASSDVFNPNWYGSCETVTVTAWSCVNATKVLNWNQLIITPTANFQWIWSCTVYFTDGDTIQTWVINFDIQTLKPTISWSWGTSSINPWSCDTNNKLTRNRFLTKMKIWNTPELWTFTYSISDGSTTNTKTLYDDSLVLMYNFDKVTSLWESTTVVKDLSNHWYDGAVYWATWTSNGVWWWSYSFDGTDDYIQLPSVPFTSTSTLSLRVDLSNVTSSMFFVGMWGGNYWLRYNGSSFLLYLWSNYTAVPWTKQTWFNHVVVVRNWSKYTMYVNWQNIWNWTGWSTANRPLVYVWKRQNWNFAKVVVDELRVYNRALTQDEIQFLYRSNLSKTNTWEWLFQVLNTCLDTDKTYRYTWQVMSLYGYSTWINRRTCTNIPGVSITWWTNVNFGTFDVSGNTQTWTTEYTANVQVTDWRWKNWWTGSVKISPYFLWQQNSELKFSSENFMIKTNSLNDLWHFLTWIVPEYTVWVKLNTSLNQYAGIVISWANVFTWTPYFVTNYPAWDFMCNGWVYWDMPKMQLSIPAWTPWDTYVANVYWSIEPE
jgi:hypothetical protein